MADVRSMESNGLNRRTRHSTDHTRIYRVCCFRTRGIGRCGFRQSQAVDVDECTHSPSMSWLVCATFCIGLTSNLKRPLQRMWDCRYSE